MIVTSSPPLDLVIVSGLGSHCGRPQARAATTRRPGCLDTPAARWQCEPLDHRQPPEGPARNLNTRHSLDTDSDVDAEPQLDIRTPGRTFCRETRADILLLLSSL